MMVLPPSESEALANREALHGIPGSEAAPRSQTALPNPARRRTCPASSRDAAVTFLVLKKNLMHLARLSCLRRWQATLW